MDLNKQQPRGGRGNILREQNHIPTALGTTSIRRGGTPRTPVTRTGPYPIATDRGRSARARTSDSSVHGFYYQMSAEQQQQQQRLLLTSFDSPRAPRRHGPIADLRKQYEAGPSTRSEKQVERGDRPSRTRSRRGYTPSGDQADMALAAEFQSAYRDAIASGDEDLIRRFEKIIGQIHVAELHSMTRPRPRPWYYRESSTHTYRVKKGDNIYNSTAARWTMPVKAAKREAGNFAQKAKVMFKRLAQKITGGKA